MCVCVCVCVCVCMCVWCTIMHVETVMYLKGLVLQYQLRNRVENLAGVSTRCSGLLQGEDRSGLLRPGEDQSIWLKRRQGFQPCCEAGIGEPTLSDA